MFYLLLTLGHNSSAIIVKEDGSQHVIMCGFEEERLTGKKSDSSFPINAILRCMQVAGIAAVDTIYVTHWAVDGELSSMSKKHWQPENLPKHKRIVSLNRDFTHHDAHASAAQLFAYSQPGLGNSLLLVVDGFGNFGEHISIYSCDKLHNPVLIRRFFGYSGSMGLMYQYMTAYMGMKQHEDEYKILGYEAHINEVDVDLQLLHSEINKRITKYLDGYFDNNRLIDSHDPLIRLDALPALQKSYIEEWNRLVKTLNIGDADEYTKRVVLGYYAQAVLEGVILTLVKIYNPHDLIVTGGVFYNVKLNRRLLDIVSGKLCVFPLAGDQGNALGLFYKHDQLTWPGHLNWGKRPNANLQIIGLSHNKVLCKDASEAYSIAAICYESIRKRGLVNVVRGSMEFGPRALCNTSTLALPDKQVVERINKMNGRNTIMPMAPVMHRSTYHDIMPDHAKVHLSEKYMIMAMPYAEGAAAGLSGAAHAYQKEHTGRPQVIDFDPLMNYLLATWPVLINTSFNIHGRPIVYDYKDTVDSTHFQNKTEDVLTIYVGD